MTSENLKAMIRRKELVRLGTDEALREADEIAEAVERGRKFGAPLVAHAGVTDKRMARQLGISVNDFMVRSIRLWGRTFSEERDRRAGADANQQKKGRIAREMRIELESASQ